MTDHAINLPAILAGHMNTLRDNALAERDRLTIQVAELTRELRELPLVAKEWEEERDRARTEAERWKERAEKAEANRHHHNECLFCSTRFSAVYDRCPVCAARAEAEAAKQEAAGLRAGRSVPSAQVSRSEPCLKP